MQIIKNLYKSFIFLISKSFKFDSRNLRLFISNKIISNLIKLVTTLVILTFFLSLYVYFYKPEYFGKIKHYSLSILSKYSDISLNEFKVIINGADRSDKEAIAKMINKKYQSNKISKNLNKFDSLVKEIKHDHKWIDSIHIFRSLPNKINVNITEHVPFALWRESDKHYVADSNGKIIPIDSVDEFDYLIALSGNEAYLHVKSLFNIMAINPEISSGIYSATWVGNRRWDLRFDNSLLIKLPSTKITNSWNKLVELYNTDGSFYNLKVIDLRIKDKIYLEYKDLKD